MPKVLSTQNHIEESTIQWIELKAAYVKQVAGMASDSIQQTSGASSNSTDSLYH